MKKVLFISILSLSNILFGQENESIKPWRIGCDTMMTQTDMNICSYQSYKIADLFLINLYEELTNDLANTLIKEKKYIKSQADSTQIEYIHLLERQIKLVKQSKKDFYQFLNSTVDIMKLQYDGGTIKPFAVNSYALKLTINQIEIISLMLDEIKQ